MVAQLTLRTSFSFCHSKIIHTRNDGYTYARICAGVYVCVCSVGILTKALLINYDRTIYRIDSSTLTRSKLSGKLKKANRNLAASPILYCVCVSNHTMKVSERDGGKKRVLHKLNSMRISVNRCSCFSLFD